MEDWLYWIYINAPIFFMILVVLAIALPTLFIWFWKKKVPKPARTLFWCAVKGYAPLLLVHDSGRADIVAIKERKAEGIVETSTGTFKILPRYAPLMSEEEIEKVGDPSEKERVEILKDVSGKKIQIGKRQFTLDFSHWMAKRSWLIGMPTPLFVGYTGSLCILNPEALALFEAGDLKIETGEGTLFNPKNVRGKSEDDAVQPLMLLDPRKIGKFIYSHFDTSQIAGVIQAAEERVRIGLGASAKKFLLIFAVVIVVMLVIVGIMYLPKLLQGVA